MKKIFTSLVTVLAVGLGWQASAQNQPYGDNAIKTNLIQSRLVVDTPLSFSGLKKATVADWGRDTTLIKVPVVRGLDSLALNPLTNASAIAGKVCLLFRGGGVTFSQKATYAANAGALAVIIVNNISGDPVAMGNTAGSTPGIPVLMVTDVDGAAMDNALRNGQTVKVSISNWNLSATHDLAILTSYQSTPHALNIPWSQLAHGASKAQYKNFVGGAIVNYGTSAETGIVVRDTVTFTPTGGSAATVHTGSYNIASIGSPTGVGGPADSVEFGFGASTSAYNLPAPSGTGVYNYKYSLTYGNADQVPQDNMASFNQYATDSIFCKGAYDYVRNQPVVTQSFRPGSIASNWSWGPMYYVSKGRHIARSAQYWVSTDAGSLNGMEAFALLFKWTDGSNSQPTNTYAEGGELNLVGLSRKVFSPTDTTSFMVMGNLSHPANATVRVILDSNSWYWVAAQGTSQMFIGVDGTMSPFTRSYIQATQNNVNDMPELLWTDDYDALAGSGDVAVPFPFSVVNSRGIQNVTHADSISFDEFYYVPNIALHLSKNPVTVGVNEVVKGSIGQMNVFPVPANDQINVEVKFASLTNKAEYRLLDITGKVVYKVDHINVQNETFSIPSQSLSSGVYYLAVFTENGHTTEKVVVRH